MKRKQNEDIFKQKREIYLGKNKNIEEEDEIKEQDDKGSKNDDNDDGNGKNEINKKDDDFGEDDFPERVVKMKTTEKLFRIQVIRKLNLLKKYIRMMMRGLKWN